MPVFGQARCEMAGPQPIVSLTDQVKCLSLNCTCVSANMCMTKLITQDKCEKVSYLICQMPCQCQGVVSLARAGVLLNFISTCANVRSARPSILDRCEIFILNICNVSVYRLWTFVMWKCYLAHLLIDTVFFFHNFRPFITFYHSAFTYISIVNLFLMNVPVCIIYSLDEDTLKF